jgi:serine/threonine-protein kinase
MGERDTLAPGDVFAGFTIEHVLGIGGMGTVYLAAHPRLPRQVALKLLHPDLTRDDYVRSRFEAEAEHAARLEHPNIVAVYDRGREGDRWWIVMQYVIGTDAYKILDQEGALDPGRAVHIITETAQALDYAHLAGVLHRDVKPANILLERDTPGRPGRVLLADFGIAKALAETQHLTKTGMLVASLQYTAPEQFEGTTLDARADVYSLGCTLFHLLTGQPPYPGTSLPQLMHGHLNMPIPRPSLVRPGVPTEFDAVIARALAKNRDDRYPSCGALAADASRALTPRTHKPAPALLNQPAQTTRDQVPEPPGLHADPSHTAATVFDNVRTPAPPVAQPGRSARRRWIILAAALIAITALVGALGYWKLGGGRHENGELGGGPHENVVATKVTATIPVGAGPGGVALDPGTHAVYVTHAVSDGTVSVIDADTRTVTATIPVGKFPLSVVVDPATHTVYVANADIFPSDPDASTVSVIDPATRTVTATIPVGNTPEGVVVDPATHTLYTVNFGAYAVKVIDPATRTVIAQIRVGRGPVSVAIDPGTHTVYTTNILDNTVSVIDADTRTVTATIRVGNTPTSVAVDPGSRTVYVTNGSHYYVQGSDNTVSVIDPDTRTVTATIAVGTDPTSVAIDPGTHTVYIANRGDNTVSVLDPRTRTITAAIPVGNSPDGIAVDPGTHTVYVANGGENTVTVIEPER